MEIIKFGGSVITGIKHLKHISSQVLKPGVIFIFSAFNNLSRLLRGVIANAESGAYSPSDASNSIAAMLGIDRQNSHYSASSTTSSPHFDLSPHTRDIFLALLSKLETLLLGIDYTSESNGRITDEILSYGEILTSLYLRDYLDSLQNEYKHFDSSKFFITSNDFGTATPLVDAIKANVLPFLRFSDSTPLLLEGFIGCEVGGMPTTMGFESSNLTALVIADITGVDSIKYISKVDGIYSADPEIYSSAIVVGCLNLNDAISICSKGTRILHHESLIYARNKGVSLSYCNLDMVVNTVISASKPTAFPIMTFMSCPAVSADTDSKSLSPESTIDLDDNSQQLHRSISLEQSGIQAATDYCTITILLPRNFTSALPLIIDYICDRILKSSIEIVKETASRILRFDVSNFAQIDFDMIHSLFDGIRKQSSD